MSNPNTNPFLLNTVPPEVSLIAFFKKNSGAKVAPALKVLAGKLTILLTNFCDVSVECLNDLDKSEPKSQTSLLPSLNIATSFLPSCCWFLLNISNPSNAEELIDLLKNEAKVL